MESEGWNSLGASDDGNGIWSATFDNTAETSNGETVEFKANTSSSKVDNSEITFQAESDISGPSITLEQPSGATNDEDQTIEVGATDDVSGVENISMTVLDDNDDEVDSNTCDSSTCDLDNLGLDDGEYTVEASSYDTIGNENSENSLSFTVDTEYDGDSDPDFWVEKDGDEINDDYFDFEDDVELVADFGDADSESDTTVSCIIEGEEIDTFTVSEGDDDPDESDTTCDIDYDEDEDYYDTNAEIYLEMEDEAGNTEESDTQELGFDASTPTISEFESSSGVSIFNEDFEMSYEAFDSVSGIDYLDYSVADGEESQLDEESGNFMVDTSGLERGSFEVQAQAVDNSGKVSDERSFEFEFYPDEVPELELEGDSELNVTSGSESTLELELSNTGRLLVPEGEINGSEDFVESASYGDVAPRESETVDVTFSPENGLGEYSVTLEASTVDASHTVDVLVRADSSEQDEIDAQIQSYREDLDDLSSRVESLRPSLSQERSDRIDSDYEEFESQVTEAEQAVEEGRYYEADEILGNLNTSRQSAESTFDTVKTEHETAMRNRYIIAGLFFVLLLTGGGAGFILYSDDYEVDIDSLKDMDIGSSGEQSDEEGDGYSHSETEEEEKSALDKIRDRVDNLRGTEEQEPEYEFK